MKTEIERAIDRYRQQWVTDVASRMNDALEAPAPDGAIGGLPCLTRKDGAMSDNPSSPTQTVYLAVLHHRPVDGGPRTVGAYSTEQAAWAALGKLDEWGTNTVVPMKLDADPSTS